MTYRGVYKDGVIIPETTLRLADGTELDFDIVQKRAAGKKKSPKSTTSRSREQRVAAFMTGFGILKGDRSSKN